MLPPGGAISFGYDRGSLPTSIDYPDGSSTRTRYDDAGRIIGIDQIVKGSTQSSTTYQYDQNGNRKTETITEGTNTRTTHYQYDRDDRLTQTDVSDKNGSRQITYTLDPAGNRDREIHSGSGAYASESYTRNYTHNTRNQVKTIDQSGTTPGQTKYDYDADGNLIQTQGNAGNAGYTWNARGQLTQATRNGSEVGKYRYDADGLREEKTTPSQTRRTLWIDGFAALDSDQNGNQRYEAGPNGRSPVVLSGGGNTEYLHADALGSITQSTSGSLNATTQYDAWGNAQGSGMSRNKFGYTGHQPDGETGLVYFKARYYDPQIGKFISQDPAEGENSVPLSWRGYLYANDNPLYYIDKNGMWLEEARQGMNDWFRDLWQGGGKGADGDVGKGSSDHGSTTGGDNANGSGNNLNELVVTEGGKGLAAKPMRDGPNGDFAATGGRDPKGLKSALYDTGKGAYNGAVSLVEAAPNLMTGAIPGGSDYVPFLDGVRAKYDTPLFGTGIEIVASLGTVKILSEIGSAARTTQATRRAGAKADVNAEDAVVANEAAGTLGRIESRFGSASREVGFVVDSDTGKILTAARQPYGQVGSSFRFSPEQWSMAEGNWITHNHPSGLTLGLEDVAGALSSGARGIRASSSTGTFELSFDGAFGAAYRGEYGGAYGFLHAETNAIGRGIMADVRSGALTVPNGATGLQHKGFLANEMWARYATQTPGLRYTFTPR